MGLLGTVAQDRALLATHSHYHSRQTIQGTATDFVEASLQTWFN